MFVYIYEMKINKKNFGFQEQFTNADMSRALMQMYPFHEKALDVLKQLFASIYSDVTGGRYNSKDTDLDNLYVARTSLVFPIVASSTAATSLDYSRWDGHDKDILLKAANRLYKVFRDNGCKLSESGKVYCRKRIHQALERMASMPKTLEPEKRIAFRRNEMIGMSYLSPKPRKVKF